MQAVAAALQWVGLQPYQPDMIPTSFTWMSSCGYYDNLSDQTFVSFCVMPATYCRARLNDIPRPPS